MQEVLIVEDDPGIGRGLNIHLQSEGYQPSWAKSLAEARVFLQSTRPAMVILDLGLPDGSGLDFLKQLRAEGVLLPILVLTAQTDEDTVVRAFESGANDFVKKPFSTRELTARLKAHLQPAGGAAKELRFGDLKVSIDHRSVEYAGRPFDVNRKEFDLLCHLVRRAEQAVSRESLVESIDKDGEIFDRTVDSHISHLRARFRKAGINELQITSIYGFGYRLERA